MMSSSRSRSPSSSAPDERGGEVAGRPAAPVGHEVGVVGDQLERGLHPGDGHVAEARLAVQHQVGEAAQLVAVGRRHPHQLGHDVHRQLAGEVRDQVEVVAAVERPVEVGAGERPDVGLELLDPPGVNARDTRPRIRPWRGGSMAMNELVRWASGPYAEASRLTPYEDDSRAVSRKPSITSA